MLGPKNIYNHFSQIFAILPYFNFKNVFISKNLNSAIWAQPDSDSYWLLVNNALCSKALSGAR